MSCQNNKLFTFLLGTIDNSSPLQKLRGQDVLLRIIWTWACEEWWQLHIQHYCTIPVPSHRSSYEEPSLDAIPDMRRHDMFGRKQYIDCPLAVITDNMQFPPLGSMPEAGGEPINVNMMPFDLFSPEETLPSYLQGYLPLILKCRQYNKPYDDYLYATGRKVPQLDDYDAEPPKVYDHNLLENRIAYITVDERPLIAVGVSHRRGGVHVECPGALRHKEVADKSQYTPDLSWYHPWGLGTAAGEFFVGGIFVASNAANTTAVWNSRVHDTFGDIIGPHGSLERCRDILGPPSKVLDAGELIWMSDRTPHESLPIHDPSIRRQFFRLVVGEIAFWFPEHNTSNPLGFSLPENVAVVEGNKFRWSESICSPVVWECGNVNELKVAREESIFRTALYANRMGLLCDEFLRRGINSIGALLSEERYDEVIEVIRSLEDRHFSNHSRYFIEAEFFKIMYSEDFAPDEDADEENDEEV